MLKKAYSVVVILLLFTFSANANQTEPFKKDGFFPLFQEQSHAKGVKSPKGFFVSPFYNYINEDMNISGVEATLPESIIPIPIPISGINLNDVSVKANNIGVRLGVWVFPFLSVYGMYTHTETDVKFKLDASEALGQLAGLGSGVMDSIMPLVGMLGSLKGAKSEADTFGLGITAAYGVPKAAFGLDVFGNMDLNVSTSQVSLLDNSIEVIVFSPRLGVSKEFANEMSFALWFGGMYRDNLNSSKKVKGTYELGGMGIDFQANQSVKDPWNMLVGGRFTPCDYFNILVEYGFIKKQTVNVSLSFNFS